MIGYISDGVYVRTQPTLEDMLSPEPSTLAKVADMDQQRFEHQYELIQPYDSAGKPNPDFIQAYPEEAKTYGFIKETPWDE